MASSLEKRHNMMDQYNVCMQVFIDRPWRVLPLERFWQNLEATIFLLVQLLFSKRGLS